MKHQAPQTIRIFVSSPSDVDHERRRVSQVVAQVGGEFASLIKFEVVRWETSHYSAHSNPQMQIPEASECDLVVAIFAAHLGTELPPSFPRRLPDGAAYPSGSAYEVLTAIDARNAKPRPDVYIYRKNVRPVGALDDEDSYQKDKQNWDRLNRFFGHWLHDRHIHRFNTTDDFANDVEALLRAWLHKHVLHGAHLPAWPIELRGSPFRGLKPFDARHAPIFFGRSRDVELAIRRFGARERVTQCLFVVGASGVGKSSFVHAGLAPRLITPGVVDRVDLWRTVNMRPGTTPIETLAQLLLEGTSKGTEETDDFDVAPALPEIADGDYKTSQALAALMETGSQVAADPIVNALRRIAAKERDYIGSDHELQCHLLIIVDQLDDLFTAGADAARDRFAKLLITLANTGLVWLIATLRIDLYERYLSDSSFLALKQTGVDYNLGLPTLSEISEIIRQPALASGLEFERSPDSGDGLDTQLLRDAGSADILPLLEFALELLFDKRDATGTRGRLTFATYNAFGGIDGAIDSAAEEALKTLGSGEVGLLPQLLRRLVTLAWTPQSDTTGQMRWTIQSIPLEDLANAPAYERLVNALRGARLLTTSSEGNIPSVRLAHLRVIESWKAARQIIQDNAVFYRISSEVRQQYHFWQMGGGLDSSLISSHLSSDARWMMRRFKKELDAEIRNFVAVSAWKHKMSRLPLQMLAAVVTVIAIYFASAGGAYVLDLLDDNPNRYYQNMVEFYFNTVLSSVIFATLFVVGPIIAIWFLTLYAINRSSLSTQYGSRIRDIEPYAPDFLAASRWRLLTVILHIAMLGLTFCLAAVAMPLWFLGSQQSDQWMWWNDISGYVISPLILVAWPICATLFARRQTRYARSYAEQHKTRAPKP